MDSEVKTAGRLTVELDADLEDLADLDRGITVGDLGGVRIDEGTMSAELRNASLE